MHSIPAEYETIALELSACLRYLAQKASLTSGMTIVLGCSTSEVTGGRIGKNSVPQLGHALASAMLNTCDELSLRAAFQCCEHLNRALVMEQTTLQAHNLLQVNARPMPKAGGSVAAAAWELFKSPALAARIQADAALDVGDTLVGMHLRPVAVPLRMELPSENGVQTLVSPKVGHAHVVMAFSRLPYIGGERACYV